MDKREKLPVIEVVSVIQGEGQSTGQPMILIRLIKCNLNCMFKGSICDSSETSWNYDPKTGSQFSLLDIEDHIIKNPHIKKVMITGGNPSYQPDALRSILQLCKRYSLGTEMEDNGTTFAPIYDGLLDLVSLSPKMGNSTPDVGSRILELDHIVTQADHDKHEKSRVNFESTKKWMENFNYQLKFVISDEEEIEEAVTFAHSVGADMSKVYFMPEGATRSQLSRRRKWLYERCIELGINYTDRLHIIVYNNLKGV